jgi:Mn2+/Fe2+ NRAMP family transporter
VETLQAAHDLMEQTLSSSIAPAAFGMALLCAGQLSTFTGTIAGQVRVRLLHMGGSVLRNVAATVALVTT